MTMRNRPVSDRQKALEPILREAHFTLAGVRELYEWIGGRKFSCTISGYCRTRIFEFPGIDLRPHGEEPHHAIYASPSIQACVALDLVGYFENSTSSKHYAISPDLRRMVGDTDEKIKSQQKGRVPVFLVVEEFNQLTPAQMVKGECTISDEVVERDGEKVPRLTGGRKDDEFIVAWATVDGAWPELPNNQRLVNMILAGVRVGQQTSGPIRKYLDRDGLVTDDGRFVVMIPPTTMSARLGTATPMDAAAYRDRVCEISSAIEAMKKDISAPHMALLVNSMYSDEYKDDAYRRLQYLGLWQSLADAARPYLDYTGDVRRDNVVVAGNKTLQELCEYRGNIAHWWTDTIDENLVADLQRTINELVRRRYF